MAETWLHDVEHSSTRTISIVGLCPSLPGASSLGQIVIPGISKLRNSIPNDLGLTTVNPNWWIKWALNKKLEIQEGGKRPKLSSKVGGYQLDSIIITFKNYNMIHLYLVFSVSKFLCVPSRQVICSTEPLNKQVQVDVGPLWNTLSMMRSQQCSSDDRLYSLLMIVFFGWSWPAMMVRIEQSVLMHRMWYPLLNSILVELKRKGRIKMFGGKQGLVSLIG